MTPRFFQRFGGQRYLSRRTADDAVRFDQVTTTTTEQPEAEPEGHGLRRLPPNLVRKRIEHHPSEAVRVCIRCGQAKAPIGEDLSYTYVFPPEF